MRLDKFLSQQYGFTRNKAQQLIKAGLVMQKGKVLQKASFDIDEHEEIIIQEDRRIHWVSRSAEKLIGFFEDTDFIHLQKEILESTCLDVGSSTGGFTQVLYNLGATHIDAVDVGSHQLHPSLHNNPYIHSFENTDIRDFRSNKSYNFIVCDASFISLEKIIDAILRLANPLTHIILLFKPQFEVGKNFLNKKGVPKNQKVIDGALEKFQKVLIEKNCNIKAIKKSTLIGESGNQEYIFYIIKNAS